MGKQYKIDSDKAKKHVYANNGEGPNPYEEGTRIHRLWNKWQGFYLEMEWRMDDLYAAYGQPRSTKNPTS